MNNKKGISAIVATVLIILITVAAVTIIWAAIIPMITNQLESSTVCLDAVTQVQLFDGGYTCKNATADTVSFQIKHGAKSVDLVDVQVLISAGGTTKTYLVVENATLSNGDDAEFNDLPGANEEKVFKLVDGERDVDLGTVADIDSISIAPVVGVGSTQKICDVSSTRDLRDC